MEVQEIVFIGPLPDALEHEHVQCVGIANRAVKAQGARPCRFELCGRARIPARIQRYIVAQRDQFFRKPMNDAFSTAIKFRRNCFS